MGERWPLESNVGNFEKSLCKFKHKLLTGLPTKNNMIKRTLKDKKSEKQKIKDIIKYQDNMCINCGNIENTEHIFICKDKIHFWNNAADKMLKVINKEL